MHISKSLRTALLSAVSLNVCDSFFVTLLEGWESSRAFLFLPLWSLFHGSKSQYKDFPSCQVYLICLNVYFFYLYIQGSDKAQLVKNPPAIQEI